MREHVRQNRQGRVLDSSASQTGDDAAILMTHTRGVGGEAATGWGDPVVELEMPEEVYDLAGLLRDTERYGVESIGSRATGEQAACAGRTKRFRLRVEGA